MPISPRSVTAARFGALAMAAVALGCAAIAAMMVGRLLTARGYTGSRVRPVVVAKRDLPAAQPLSRDDLELRDWPEKSVPAGSFSNIDSLLSAVSSDTNASPVPTAGILAGEPVVLSRLSVSSAGTGVARLVRPNMRAVALRVEDAVGKTSLVYPGAAVDVIVTIRDPGGRGPSSRIAVQNARVLTVGRDTDVATRRARESAPGKKGSAKSASDTGRTFVTLEVTPEESEVLAMARNEGELNIALRNGGDDAVIDTRGAIPAAFSAFAPPPEDEEPPPADANAAAQAAAKTSDAKPNRPRLRRRRGKRRIELVASDEPDVPSAASRQNAPAKIETYHAR